MKKKRGYVRQLKRELKGQQDHNKLLEDILSNRIGRIDELNCKFSSLKNRVRLFQYSRTFNIEEMGVSRFSITMEDVKRNMIDDLLHNEVFLDSIKVEHDEYYVGIGSRLHASIEVLTPEY